MSVKYLNAQRITINSANRSSGSHNNFVIPIKLDPSKKVNRVAVLTASFKKTIYLVEPGQNTFLLTESGFSAVTVTVSTGQKNASEFATELVGLLNAASPNGWTYTVTLNTITALYTFTCSGGNPTFTFNASSNDVYYLMGFEKNSINTFSGNQLISTNMLNFQLDLAYIHSNIVTNELDNRLCTLNINGPDFCTIFYECLDVEANAHPMAPWSTEYSFSTLDPNGQPYILSLPIIFDILVWLENDSLDQLCRKMDGLFEIIKYKLLKSK